MKTHDYHCCSTTIQREVIVAFSWQQWLCKRATVLTLYILAYIVIAVTKRYVEFDVACGKSFKHVFLS